MRSYGNLKPYYILFEGSEGKNALNTDAAGVYFSHLL